MTPLKQIAAVTAMSLLGIPSRMGPCLVIIVGIAGVVAVLVSVFAMVQGFSENAERTGRADRAIVLAGGAETEASSGLSREDVAAILNAGAIRTNAAGKPIASADMLAFVRLTDRRTGLDAFATVRGVGQQALALRPEIRLVEGRLFGAGLQELVVGRALQRRLAGLEIGSRIPLPQGDWTIVGVFESGANARESELLGDADTLLSAYRRNVFNSVTVALHGAEDFAAFRAAIAANPSLSVKVERERDYFLAASADTRSMMRFIALFISGVMATGAAFAAVNAMYSAISARTLEIATLRAIGYGGAPVVVSIAIEALLFALIGGAVGAALAWQFFNGNAVTTQSSASPAPVTFLLNVTPGMLALGVASACAIGFVGGLFPAVRAARLPVVSALRST